jgi:hypothetical protein
MSVIYGRLETHHIKLMCMCTVPLLQVTFWSRFIIEVKQNMYTVMNDEHKLTVGNSVGYSGCEEVELYAR